MQGADAERREAGERLAIQTYFVVAILVVAVPLATYHEYVARGAGAGLLSPTDAARARADIAARLEGFARPPRRAARPVAGAYSVEVVSVNGAAVDADATLGALVRAVDARAGVRAALSTRELFVDAALAHGGRERCALDTVRVLLAEARRARHAVEAPFRGRHRTLRFVAIPAAPGATIEGNGTAVIADARGAAADPGGAALVHAGAGGADAFLRLAASRLRAEWGLGAGAADAFRLADAEADALAVAAAEAALADAFDRLEDLRAVGPLARPSDAPAVAARLLEAARTARARARGRDGPPRRRGRADAALDDPALALPARMPIERPLAVYAPIVAPLVAPLVMGCAKETRRYRATARGGAGERVITQRLVHFVGPRRKIRGRASTRALPRIRPAAPFSERS